MSAVLRVTEAVKARGEATVAQITPNLDGLTHKQILDALANAKARGTVRVKVMGNFRGGRETVWEFGTFKKRKKRAPKPQAMPIASVWELGTPRAISMPMERGRVFNLLGSWDGF